MKDKSTIIGLTLCLVIMLAWPSISKKMGCAAEDAETTAPTESVSPSPDNKETNSSPAANQETAAPAANQEAVIPAEGLLNGIMKNDDMSVVISPLSGGISEIEFFKYSHNDKQGGITLTADNSPALFSLNIPHARVTEILNPQLAGENIILARTVTISNTTISILQTFSIDSSNTVNCRYILENTGSVPIILDKTVVSGGSIAPWHVLSGDKMRTLSHRLDLSTTDGDLEDIDADEDDEDFFFVRPPQVFWASVSNKHFCSILKSSSGSYTLWQARTYIKDARSKLQPVISIGAVMPQMTLLPGVPVAFDFSAYTGPKSVETLSAFAKDAENVMHLAWGPLNYLARFLMWILNLLYSLCGSYGISIIILTLLVRTAFYPLTSRGNESMRKMQKIQPKFKELKEKYKDNPQLLNQKMSELYRQEGINPLAGCMPILLQIPIFFALYAMLDNAIALRHVPFLWCQNLAAADTVCRIPLGFSLPFTDISAIPINPLVILMTILMIVQQKMSSVSMDPAQKRMMAMMPAVMLIFLYDLPSGLTLYWTISNLFSIIQLWLQKRRSQALQDSVKQSK